MAIFNGDALGYVPTSAPADQQIAAINRIVDRLNQMLSQMVLSDGATRRMFIGYQKDGWGSGKDFGMKVSIPGIDVLTAEDNQLLFKMDISTWYWYDPATTKNNIQLGILPDGTSGMVAAKPGTNVADNF